MDLWRLDLSGDRARVRAVLDPLGVAVLDGTADVVVDLGFRVDPPAVPRALHHAGLPVGRMQRLDPVAAVA